MESWVQADGLVPMRFAIFPVHVSEVLRLPRKSDARSYKLLHLSHKITFPKLKICSKMQALSGNQRPDLLTSLMNMSLVLHLPRKCIFPDPLQMSHACHQFEIATKPSPLCSLSQGAQSLAPATRKCIWTQDRQFFNTFDLEMCFAPQQRALFRHLNFKQCSEPGFSWDSTLNPSRPLNLNWWEDALFAQLSLAHTRRTRLLSRWWKTTRLKPGAQTLH